MKRLQSALVGLMFIAATLAATATPADAYFKWPKFRVMGGCPVWDFSGRW